MADGIFYVCAAIIAIAAIIISRKIKANQKRKKLEQKLTSQWGRIPADDYRDTDMKAISGFFRELIHNGAGTFFIDDITWNDLDMDRVFRRINNTQSTVGEEILYSMLRRPAFDERELKERDRLIEYFRKNPAERLELQKILAGLGKRRNTQVYGYFFGEPVTFRYRRYILQAVALLLSPLLMIADVTAGFVAVVGLFVFNMTVYYKSRREYEIYLDSLGYMADMVRCSRKIAAAGIPGIKEYAGRLEDLSGRMRSFSINSFYQLFYQTGDYTFLEPLKSMFLLELIAFGRLLETIYEHRQALRGIYETVGFLDSMISAASYRESLDFWTVPELNACGGAGPVSLSFRDACHPLIENAVPNSLDTVRPVLITGSNASGKSTFLKTTAINAILAQTIYTCVAREYRSCYFRVFTSMALKDDLEGNTSYYVAEINSLKRIMDNLDGQVPVLSVIDEVLRGTNTIERIAASTEILRHFAGGNCILIAATHDIELAEILKNLYDNYHFTERYEGDEIKFEYKLLPGKSRTHNAIKLLSVMGYPDHIVKNAEDRAEKFLEEGRWHALQARQGKVRVMQK
ncbi:MAG TPA: DNA mismatch repair protein MutS [Clostridiales bacterium]|jgi:DNA mismatch repair ATPase MutS|nr:DNA mismatch repair protein MutS [Clostridiales bacterium]